VVAALKAGRRIFRQDGVMAPVESQETNTLAAIFDPAHRADPYPVYREWRERSPIAQVAPGLLVVSGHAECSQVLRDPKFGHAEPDTLPQAPVEPDPDLPPDPVDDQGRVVRAFLGLNPPDHTRLRRLVSSAFTPRVVERLTPRIEAIAREQVDAVLEAGEADLMSAIAASLPVVVISELLGVPEADRERFAEWSHAMARGLDPTFLLPEAVRKPAARARSEFLSYFRELAADRRRNPGEDLISTLVAASDAGESLTENELLVTLMLLLIAGHETTTNLIGNGMLALLRDPAQLKAVSEDPGLIDQAVEEALRYDSPVQLTARNALVDTVIGDVPAPAGTFVVVLIGAANRDPAVHQHPDTFDVTRPPTRHLALGQGIHFCLGAPLARLEGRIALRELTGRLPGLRLDAEPRWKETITLRGMVDLPVSVR